MRPGVGSTAFSRGTSRWRAVRTRGFAAAAAPAAETGAGDTQQAERNSASTVFPNPLDFNILKAPNLVCVHGESRFVLQSRRRANDFPLHPRDATRSAKAKVHSDCQT